MRRGYTRKVRRYRYCLRSIPNSKSTDWHMPIFMFLVGWFPDRGVA